MSSETNLYTFPGFRLPREVYVAYSSSSSEDDEDEEVPSEDPEMARRSSSDSTTSSCSNSSNDSYWLPYCDQMVILMAVATCVVVISFLWGGLDTTNDTMPFALTPPSSTAVDTDDPVSLGDTSFTGTPRFRDPGFAQELGSVLGVHPEPETPQSLALEWLAKDDFELWNYPDVTMEQLTQRYALAVLHIATGRWNQRGGWATSSGARITECIWPGVSCDRNDTVNALALDSSLGIMQGSIPSEIALLSSLESLSFFNNVLTGEIPESLYELSNLYYLQLAYSDLSATLSPSIGKLTRLVILDVTNGGFFGSVPTELGSLPDLRRVYLAYNALDGSIPPQLGQVSTLETFLAQGTDLTGSIPLEMCALRSLRLQDFRVDCQQSVLCDAPQCCTRCY